MSNSNLAMTYSAARLPDANVIETRDHIRVVVELPGMAEEDIDLSGEEGAHPPR